MSKKTAAPTLAQVLAQSVQNDAQQAAALQEVEEQITGALASAVNALTDLIDSEDAPPTVRLAAAQSLLKSFSGIQKAAHDAKERADRERWLPGI